MNPILLIACFLTLSWVFAHDDHISNRLRCGSRAMELPPSDLPQLPRPHFIQDDQPFVPYKILYLIDDTIDQVELAKLEMATDYANGRLSKTIKARKLADVRFRNLHPDCPELCNEMPFPNEYVIPCRSITIPEASEKIKKLNEANYTLVIRILMRHQGVVANMRMEIIEANCIGNTIAFAKSCDLRTQAEFDTGPHHGFVVFCGKPSSMNDDALGILILHETLHVLMPYSLSGAAADSHKCKSLDECKDKTWKKVKRQALNSLQQPAEVTSVIAIGSQFHKAATDHFGCETAEGIELNFYVLDRNTMETKIDHSHWSEHLFPDEIMAPVKATSAHFSNLTLSALASHVRWYQVDQSQAEPLISSKPSKEFACDVTNKGCFEILQEQSGKGVKFIRPFCDVREGIDRVITSHCSPDHQRQLSCEDKVSNSRCAFLMGTSDHIYDTDVCANATTIKVGTLATHVGASFGLGTICVTTTNFPPWDTHKTNALCLHHECQADSLVLKFKPTAIDDPNCYITCSRSQSKQLSTVNWCNKAEHEVTVICPDFEQVCKKQANAPAPTSIVPKTTITSSSASTMTSAGFKTTSATPMTTSMTSAVPSRTSSIPSTTITLFAATNTVPKSALIASAAASLGIQSLEILVIMFLFHLA